MAVAYLQAMIAQVLDGMKTPSSRRCGSYAA
jgi:hypothetical protein